MRLTEFDEGPLPADWVGELERRGIAVVRDLHRDAACDVLRAYGAQQRPGSTERGRDDARATACFATAAPASNRNWPRNSASAPRMPAMRAGRAPNATPATCSSSATQGHALAQALPLRELIFARQKLRLLAELRGLDAKDRITPILAAAVRTFRRSAISSSSIPIPTKAPLAGLARSFGNALRPALRKAGCSRRERIAPAAPARLLPLRRPCPAREPATRATRRHGRPASRACARRRMHRRVPR